MIVKHSRIFFVLINTGSTSRVAEAFIFGDQSLILDVIAIERQKGKVRARVYVLRGKKMINFKKNKRERGCGLITRRGVEGNVSHDKEENRERNILHIGKK